MRIESGASGSVTIENAYRDLFIQNKRATHPLTLLRYIRSSAAAHVGIEYGVKGPVFATCSACSTPAHAIGLGRDFIRSGLIDVAIVGASESAINYGAMKAWQAMHVLSPEGCFPFSAKRNGTVLGESAGRRIGYRRLRQTGSAQSTNSRSRATAAPQVTRTNHL